MDLLPVIDAWLKHPVFLTGRELYARYGANESYKRLFARREDQGAFTVLIEAIRELRENTPSEPVKAPPAKQPSRPSEAADAPEPVQALINQRKAFWAEVVYLKNVLRQSDSQEERGKAAFRILDLRKKINDIWYQTNYFDSQGTLPELPSDEQLDAQLEKLDDLTLRSTYQNNQKYLSKYAKRDRTPAVQAEYLRRQEQQPKIEQIQKARKESQSIQF